MPPQFNKAFLTVSDQGMTQTNNKLFCVHRLSPSPFELNANEEKVRKSLVVMTEDFNPFWLELRAALWCGG